MKLSTDNEAHCAALSQAFTERLKFTLTGAGRTASFVADRLSSWPCELGSGRRSIELQLTQVSEVVGTIVPWTGEGLPPVGTVCEVQHPDKPDTWCKCTILVWDSECAVFSADANYPFAYDGNGYPENFRPIRTPEQIAAEERERAIDELCQAAEERITEEVAALLYDAGYRK